MTASLSLEKTQGWLDGLHSDSRPEVHWTRANAEEIFPDAISHFTWSFVGAAGERGWRGSVIDAGMAPASTLEIPDDPSERAWAIFYGRPAFNFAHLRSFDFAAFSSTNLDHEVRRGGPTRSRLRQRATMFCSVALVPWRLARLRKRSQDWWRSSIATIATEEPLVAATRLEEALAVYEQASRLHVLNSIGPVASAYSRANRLAAAAGEPQVASSIMSGFQSLEEVNLAQVLWRVAHGDGALADFIARYGYRGPRESEASSHSWREDPTPVEGLIDNMRTAAAESEPMVAQRRRSVERRAVQSRLLANLGWRRRLVESVMLAIGRFYVSLRQVGKVSLVQSIDVARAGARSIGRTLHQQSRIDDPDDIFFLTIGETIAAARTDSGGYQNLIAWRRERRTSYRALTIPREFHGVPEPIAETPTPQHSSVLPTTVLRGSGVSSGVIEARARVVSSAEETVESGEILVAPFTDPGWTPLLIVAAGVVLDVGGTMSHGAIIARELGIPCVLGVSGATRVIRTGDRLRLNGDDGTVEILSSEA